MFQHEPLLRHGRRHTAVPDRAFSAPTAEAWLNVLFKDNDLASDDRFFSYVSLENINAQIYEKKSQGRLDIMQIDAFRDQLIAWYQKYQSKSRDFDPFARLMLWHAIFLSLYADFDVLECAIGKDDIEVARSHEEEVSRWALSPNGKRCIIHASLIHAEIEQLSIASEPAIHVPRSLFQAAVAWYCCAHFGADSSFSAASCNGLDFSEIRILGINPAQHLFQINGFRFGKPPASHSSTLFGLADCLRRVGHWEISRKFASILDILLQGEKEDSVGIR